ncbi:hypothetical protein LIS76_02290 [Peribacillus asahii]|nr:hypothetical protein [Peribacillus asahii]USK70661.1 hypothetical protein LIS76_02290 [Peribacillus asahii]
MSLIIPQQLQSTKPNQTYCHTAKKPVKIGVVAKIKADVVGSAVCKLLKNDH